MNNIQGPGTQRTGHNRGALPPIPTITTDPSTHHLPVPSHVAQTNRRMAKGNQDRIPLQSLVSPVDDTLKRDQNRTLGARSNAGTRAKTVMFLFSSFSHQYIKCLVSTELKKQKSCIRVWQHLAVDRRPPPPSSLPRWNVSWPVDYWIFIIPIDLTQGPLGSRNQRVKELSL